MHQVGVYELKLVLIYSKKEIERWIKEDTLDKKTNEKLDALFKKQGVYDDPIVKKWLAYYDK